MSPTLRWSTHKTVLVLGGLFRRGAPLEPTETPDGRLRYKWASKHGGGGWVWIQPNCDRCCQAIERARRDESLWPRARVLLAAAFKHHGRRGEWRLERAAELLHGPRNRHRSRMRHLEPLALLEHFFSHADFHISAEAKPLDKPRRKRKKGPDRRGEYGDTIEGRLLHVRRINNRSATVTLNDRLHQCIASSQFWDVPRAELRLPVAGHTNPRGDKPSLAARFRIRMAAYDFARLRFAKREPDGSLQRVRLEEILDRWAELDAPRIIASRRTQSFLTVAERDLRSLDAAGGIHLVDVDRDRNPSQSLLQIVGPARAPKAAAGRAGSTPPRSDHHDERPLAGVTATGTARSHAPPAQLSGLSPSAGRT